jgi:regulatory protein
MRSRVPAVVDHPDDEDAAEAAALRILGGASQSAGGLTKRLRQRGYSAAAAASAVERCRALGYVDDGALTEALLARHRRAGHGRARALADLRRRGVSSSTVAEALDAAPDDGGELESAVATARRLYERERTRDDDDDHARRRIAAALQRRGFAASVIAGALRALVTLRDDDAVER